MTSVKKLAIHGTFWTLVSYGISSVLRFGSNLALTWLLTRDLFGLMTLVSTVITGLNFFSDIGLAPNIIQSKRGDDPDFLNTAWTMQSLRGFIIWLACVALTKPLADFYNEPRLLWLIPIVGLNTIFAGFKSTTYYTLNRHLDVRRLAIFDLAGQIISYTVMITWAWLNPSVAALAAGTLSASIFYLVWSHFLIPGFRNRFRWDKEAAKELFQFGKWVFFSTAVTFFGMQADRLILPKLVGFEGLGVYGIALSLAEMPKQVVGMIGWRVLLPVISKLSDAPRLELRDKILKNRGPLLLATAAILAIVVSFGDLVFYIYKKDYIEGSWMLPLLAIGIWPNVLHESIRQSLIAIGKPNYEAFGQSLKSIFVCAGIPISYYLTGSILGPVIVSALNDIPLYGVISYGLWKEKLSSTNQDIQATVALLAGTTLLLTCRLVLGFGSPLDRLFIS